MVKLPGDEIVREELDLPELARVPSAIAFDWERVVL